MTISQQFLVPMSELRLRYPDFDTSKALFRISPDIFSELIRESGLRIRDQEKSCPPSPLRVWGMDIEVDSNLAGTSCELVYLPYGEQVYPFNVELAVQ